MAASKLKASEKKAICKKLVATLKKRYGGSVPKNNRDVLNSLLFAICLEDNSHDDAEEIYQHLLDSFHDLNEIRVSSITELESVFERVHESEWKALRVRSLLQYVFEEQFQFEYEGVRRKTYEQAFKQLSKVKDISPFVLLQTLQLILGSHVVPADQTMLECLEWLGLIDSGSSVHEASDQLKSCVAKPEVGQFIALVRAFAVESQCREMVQEDRTAIGDADFDATNCVDRVQDLFGAVDKSRKRKFAVEIADDSGSTSPSNSKGKKPKAGGAHKNAKATASPKQVAAKKPSAKKSVTKAKAEKSPAKAKTATKSATKKKVVKSTKTKAVKKKAKSKKATKSKGSKRS